MRPLALLVVALVAASACTRDDQGPTVTLTVPGGDTVAGGLALEMAADGITIEEAGEARDGAGHFHVIADAGCVDAGDPVPRDADHVHFGKGQAAGTLYLAPGEHEICLQVADGLHVAMAATDRVSVTSRVGSQDDWCKVAGEVDVLFEETDNGDAPFADRQIAYENIHRLAQQLDDGLDEVDSSARASVGRAIGAVLDLTAAYTAADDEEAAFAAVMAVLEAAEDEMTAAAVWIDDTCGISINS
jgi:hypothetical protein